MAEPTLSTHALEDHFGVELFHRRGRGVELTAIGRELLTITEGLFGHEGGSDRAVTCGAGAREGLAQNWRRQASRCHGNLRAALYPVPQSALAVRLVSEADVLNGLLNFDFDAGVIGHQTNDPRFFSSFYKRYRINIVVNIKHPLAKRRSIRIKDLEGQRVVQRTGGAFNRALNDAGVKIQPVLETSSLEGVVAAIMQGIGVGAISESGIAGIMGHQNLRVIPISDLAMFTEAHVVCLAERRTRPLIASFLRHRDVGAYSLHKGRTEQVGSRPDPAA